jgi:hypothetical protein
MQIVGWAQRYRRFFIDDVVGFAALDPSYGVLLSPLVGEGA